MEQGKVDPTAETMQNDGTYAQLPTSPHHSEHSFFHTRNPAATHCNPHSNHNAIKATDEPTRELINRNPTSRICGSVLHILFTATYIGIVTPLKR
jgi:hypothetical protein